MLAPRKGGERVSERTETPSTFPRRKKTTRRISNRSFYASAVSEAEQLQLPEAMKIEGLDQEIALLRVRLSRLAQEDPALLFKGMELLGEDRFVWASDFPHIDAEYGPVAELKENIKSLPESAQRKMLGENAARIYNLPM